MDSVADNAGYIVFKDRKQVLFYSNDLAGTPPKPILSSANEEAVMCMLGWAKINVGPVKKSCTTLNSQFPP